MLSTHTLHLQFNYQSIKMAPRKSTVCLSELLGVATHEEVLAFFRKNKRKMNIHTTIPKLLEKFGKSVEEETGARRNAHQDYVKSYKEYKKVLRKFARGGKHVNWCIMNIVQEVECNCDHLVFTWPVALMEEIINAYHGIFTEEKN